jgi:hypothetical protein
MPQDDWGQRSRRPLVIHTDLQAVSIQPPFQMPTSPRFSTGLSTPGPLILREHFALSGPGTHYSKLSIRGRKGGLTSDPGKYPSFTPRLSALDLSRCLLCQSGLSTRKRPTPSVAELSSDSDPLLQPSPMKKLKNGMPEEQEDSEEGPIKRRC